MIDSHSWFGNSVCAILYWGDVRTAFIYIRLFELGINVYKFFWPFYFELLSEIFLIDAALRETLDNELLDI